METVNGGVDYIENAISIHSTARVETRRNPGTRPVLVHFNPLHREGGDAVLLHLCFHRLISIHSTARVETFSALSPRADASFQSTPPRGWRHFGVISHIRPGRFQSTPPRGWRLRADDDGFLNNAFQSTPPRGWRPNLHEVLWQRTAISIHSTARVETSIVPNSMIEELFQSTPPRGWRLPIVSGPSWQIYFNPLHREGGD